MNSIRPTHLIRHAAMILAGLAGSLLALSAGSTAAFAYVMPPGPSSGGTVAAPAAQVIVTGGMPGWQITVIAVAAAAVAAAVAVFLDRVRTARHEAAHSA
jgi:hypothetical protein